MTTVTIFKNADGRIQGATDADDRKYKSYCRKVRDLEPGGGELITFGWKDSRCPKHHSRFIFKIRNLFQRTEAFGSDDDLRRWLIQASGHVKWEPGPDSTPNALPISIKFDSLEEAEFIELHRAVDFVLWSAEGQAKLWPALSEEQRYMAMKEFMEAFE